MRKLRRYYLWKECGFGGHEENRDKGNILPAQLIPFMPTLEKGRKSPANHHQVVSFQVYLISTTPHPRLGLILVGMRSERVVDVLGRAERADVHLGGEGIINTSSAWCSVLRALGPPCFISSGLTQIVGLLSLPYGQGHDFVK